MGVEIFHWFRRHRRSFPPRACVAIAAACWLGSAQSGTADHAVQMTRIDGRTERGTLLGLDSNGLRMSGVAGGAIPLDELESVRFREPQEVSGGAVVFHLTDGGRVTGELLRSQGTSLVVNLSIGDGMVIPFEQLAAIQLAAADQFVKASELFHAALADRPPGKDVLITRDLEEVKSVQGRLETLGPSSGSFHFGDRVRDFQTEKMFGVVFAQLAGVRSPAPVFVTLSDGTTLSGRIVHASADALQLHSECCGDLRFDLNQVARLDFRSDRVVYLSELTPKSEKVDGRLHEPTPVRIDQSAAAGPLMLDGKRFARGLGAHSHTRLDYALEGKFETFVATVGIDDSARPLGTVAFRVLGDGESLFESGVLSGKEAAKLVSVRVQGVDELTLIADYGDDLDLGDLANWGGARLIRPRRR